MGAIMPLRGDHWRTDSSTSTEDLLFPLYVDPRHSIARDQRPLRVRPKSARDYPQSAATMMAALEQACLLAG